MLATPSILSTNPQNLVSRPFVSKINDGLAKLFWICCRDQMPLKNYKSLKGKGYKDIALFAYNIMFNDALAPLEVRRLRLIQPKIFDLAVRLSKFCCVFKSNKILGEGASKIAYEAIKIKINDNVEFSSIKVSTVALLVIEQSKRCHIEKVIEENEFAARFNSPFIVKKSPYVVKFESESSLLIVQKKFDFDFRNAIDFRFLPFLKAKIGAVRDIVKGLAVLHEEGIIHRDLKPDNFAVRKEIGILFDLGLAVNKNEIEDIKGSPLYLALELAKENGGQEEKKKNRTSFSSENSEGAHLSSHLAFSDSSIPTNPLLELFKNEQSFETDLWALGLTLFEIFSPTNDLPEIYKNKICVEEEISRFELKEFFVDIRNNGEAFKAGLFNNWKAVKKSELEIQKVISKLLSINPKERGTAREIADWLGRIYDSLN